MTINSQIVGEVLTCINGDDTANWYVGIATDPKQRLFHDHNVDEYYGSWRYWDALSEANARDTESYLLSHYRFKGGTGGGLSPRFVYVYRITTTTRE